jgi:PhnB protein
MQSFNPYITFNGNCEKALKFYETCFNGKTTFVQYFEDYMIADRPHLLSKIMHSEFEAGAIKFMACDKSEDGNLNNPSRVTLYITFESEDKLKNVFKKLAVSGKINLPLEETVWGAKVAIITDQFDINWMLVYTPE